MAKPRLLDVSVNTKSMTKLQSKLDKYPPYAIKEGLKAAEDYMNTDSFKMGMYPESKMGSPFDWSSRKQQQAFFASDGFGGGIPHQRTYELAQSGSFSINEGYLSIEYQNEPYTKFVIHPVDMILGHRRRGWKPINQFIVSKSREVVRVFENAVKGAWTKMESFMFGGGGGL